MCEGNWLGADIANVLLVILNSGWFNITSIFLTVILKLPFCPHSHYISRNSFSTTFFSLLELDWTCEKRS